ncbi:MAG: hypothetical protein NT045_09065 [Candidatus Aureabacteria bacterium]|nr:hypothetical protein [Candidatus Auribacterota bacterium]
MKRLIPALSLSMLITVTASAQSKMPRFKGDALNDGVLDSLNLTSHKILVTDFMSDINNNFTPAETKRGLRGPFYTKFNLRDSKLRCIISKNDRLTIIGRVDQLATGLKRFSNPYYILRLTHIEPGWRLDEAQDLFKSLDPGSECEDLTPQDVAAKSEEHAGDYVRIKDRFSLASTMFTTFERDLNLTNRSALKFYLENCASPCYMMNIDENKELLQGLVSGEKITVSGRLNICPVEDDAFIMLSVSKVKKGW